MSLPPLVILDRGPQWACVAKPSGLPVHRSDECNQYDTVARRLKRQLGRSVHAVHRLDRATSGCLLFTTESEAAAALQAALTSAASRKQYLAFCRGAAPAGATIDVDRPLKDDHGVMREAFTRFTVIASSVEPRVSLILCEPHTGRRHQLRRHLSGLTHPVLGDSTHGDTRVNRHWREQHGLGRLALHCVSLDLPEAPGVGVVSTTCALDVHLTRLLGALPFADDARAAHPALQLPAFDEATDEPA